MSGRPIRALFVVPHLWLGGAERHLTTLLPRMDPARISASVVCIGESGILFADLQAAGIDATALHLGKLQAVRALRGLVSIMKVQRPDVVVVRGYNAETLGRVAARLAGVEHAVVWVHNNSNIVPRGRLHRAIDRVLDRWTSRYFGIAEAQRPYLVDDLGFPDAKIRMIHNGVDEARFDVGVDRDALAEFGFAATDPVVGILGNLRPLKDHATLLRAAKIVLDDVPDGKFLVIGDGPTRAELEALTEELGITPHVHFAGERSDVARLLGAIDVFTLTSTTECFPISILEAMACGRPTVCTAVGGIPEMIDDGKTGYLVPPADPQQLARRLVDLLANPKVARRMGRAGRARVEAEFTLDRSVAAAERAIEDVVGSQYTTSSRS
jgi:glycosyltransferase involved in cell wall biosynthesis